MSRVFAQIDLETMGLKISKCAVMTCAVVVYSHEQGVIDTFDQAFDFDDQLKHGRLPDGETLTWWLQQSDEARADLRRCNSGNTVEEMEDELFEFWDQLYRNYGIHRDDIFPLSNGAAFDLAILDGMMDNVPWNFRNACCWRTWGIEYKDVIDWKMTIPGMAKHRAFSDASWQARAHLDLMETVERVR